MENELNRWWKLIGLVSGTLSLISLVQKILKVGLMPLPAAIINYYRDMLTPLHIVIESLIPFHVPEWYEDLWVLSFLSFIIYYKSTYKMDFEKLTQDGLITTMFNFIILSLGSFIYFVFVSSMVMLLLYVITLMMVLYGHTVYRLQHRADEKRDSVVSDDTNTRWILSSFMMISAAIAFFVWNAAIR